MEESRSALIEHRNRRKGIARNLCAFPDCGVVAQEGTTTLGPAILRTEPLRSRGLSGERLARRILISIWYIKRAFRYQLKSQ